MNTSSPYRVCDYMVTVYHIPQEVPHASTGENTGSHLDRLIRHVAGIYSVRLSGSCSTVFPLRGSSSIRADSTCRVVWRDLHSLSVRHPSHLTSISHPHHHHHWTRLLSSSECNLQFNMVFAVHTVATPLSHYYWPCRSQPLPAHSSGHTSLPANMSCIAAVRQCPITSYATSILAITARRACCAYMR
jgi:hypothetical protein